MEKKPYSSSIMNLSNSIIVMDSAVEELLLLLLILACRS